ncbi:hypothetical protein [Aquimarina algicola]|uniref:Uncharacterized protein n=1 Tax=Aquimarina algicola TaxID=2589995 RepID=A0A504J7D8_9FLAO|nr:hypothetical protein [Aquimarina algicola]TPN83523.1 hypothetical protein FHK87_20100 [Aquimarina algicola]
MVIRYLNKLTLIKLLSFLILISCSSFSKEEKIVSELQNNKRNDLSTTPKKVKQIHYNLVIHYNYESYGSVLLNGIPVSFRPEEDTLSGTSSITKPIRDLLVNGKNTIELIGNFPKGKYEIGIYTNEIDESGRLADEDIKIELKENRPSFFTFEANDIPKNIWDNGDNFDSSDIEKLTALALKLDQIIKKGQIKKYIELHKTEIEASIKRMNAMGNTSFAFEDIEDDLKDSFKAIRKGDGYTPIDISENEITYYVSNSKKLATITLKGKPYLTAFIDNENPYHSIWGWKMLYMKKDGKLIPILGF